MRQVASSIFSMAISSFLLTGTAFGEEMSKGDAGQTKSGSRQAKRDSKQTVSIFGEYLYWTAPQGDLEFARIGKGPTGFPGVVLGTDKIHQVNYEWRSGFRVGIGYQNQSFYFRPELSYTRFHTKGSKSASSTLNMQGVFQGVPTLPPTLAPSSQNFYINGVATISHAHSKAKLDVDYIDLNLAGADYCRRSFAWNWDFGLRGAILKSKWHTNYQIQLTQGFAPQKTKINWRYAALGIVLDGGGKFNMGAGFSIYENIVGALLLGKLHTSSKSFIVPPGIGTIGICDIHHSKYRIVPVIQSETGIAWKHSFADHFGVRINAAFEYLKWCRVGENKFYSIPEGGRYKSSEVDVDLYGFTAGLTLFF